MSKFGFNGKQLVWVVSNLGMVIRVLFLLALVISFLFIPHVVLADPIMGGSVGTTG